MRKLESAICLAMARVRPPSGAAETFTIQYLGSGLDFVDCTFQPLNCGPRTVSWNPIVTVQTVSGADGIYSFNVDPPDNPANTLTSLSLVGNSLVGSSFTTQHSSGALIGGNLAATVQGGRVTSIDGLIAGSFHEMWGFSGGTEVLNFCCVPPNTLPNGQAAMVPEPETYALMVAGLAAGALVQRRQQPQSAIRSRRNALSPSGRRGDPCLAYAYRVFGVRYRHQSMTGIATTSLRPVYATGKGSFGMPTLHRSHQYFDFNLPIWRLPSKTTRGRVGRSGARTRRSRTGRLA